LNYLQADILLQDELDHPALIFLNYKLKSQSGYPIISIVHNLHSCEFRSKWKNQIYRRIEKRYLKSVDGFIFNSQTTREAVENLVGLPKPAVTAYPCGNRLPFQITESEIESRARTPGPLQIIFLSNLLRNKGLHILLAALANIPDDSYFLTVIGDLTMDKSYVKTIRNQIQKQNLNHNILLTGPLKDEALVTKLKMGHILAVPSYYEGFGIAYLEGMGCGLPVIGTTGGAAREIITHGRNGFLIPEGDSAVLYRYLVDLLKDRDKLISMGLNARRRFESHPTWQNTGESVHKFLRSLLTAAP